MVSCWLKNSSLHNPGTVFATILAAEATVIANSDVTSPKWLEPGSLNQRHRLRPASGVLPYTGWGLVGGYGEQTTLGWIYSKESEGRILAAPQDIFPCFRFTSRAFFCISWSRVLQSFGFRSRNDCQLRRNVSRGNPTSRIPAHDYRSPSAILRCAN